MQCLLLDGGQGSLVTFLCLRQVPSSQPPEWQRTIARRERRESVARRDSGSNEGFIFYPCDILTPCSLVPGPGWSLPVALRRALPADSTW